MTDWKALLVWRFYKSTISTHMHLLLEFGRAGGGGSSGGGGGGLIIYLFVFVAIAISWYKRRKQIKRAAKKFDEAVAQDPAWLDVVEEAKATFIKFQSDWSDGDVTSMKAYLTADYYDHMVLVMRALKDLGRQNKMTNVVIINATIFNIDDHSSNEDDSFDIEFSASATDQLIASDGTILLTSPPEFSEVWHFNRDGKHWLLDSIAQIGGEEMIENGYTAQTIVADSSSPAVRMLQFANDNGFYYNYDFGWLLMPEHGLLFGVANFGRSDINYHIIGEYLDILVQFYEYKPVKTSASKWTDAFNWLYHPATVGKACTVAQATLPKHYSDISIRRHYQSQELLIKPSGMTRVRLEGVEFDKQFVVYTDDVDKVHSLELLNPSFMTKLLDTPFEINVEVVDNSLYLYSFDTNADYDVMLQLLHQAFIEMKL